MSAPAPPEPPVCFYATVKKVRVDAVTDQDLTFSTRSSKDDYESFTVSLAEVLVDPPTDAPTPVELCVGRIGNLYLSKNGWTTTSSTGSTIYKAGDPSLVLFKWPLCRPYRLLGELAVLPTSIQLEGIDLATGTAIAIDLLGADAGPQQDIDWLGAAPVLVNLSDAGSIEHGGQTMLMIWPKKLIVTGSSVKKKHIKATLDILDVNNGDFVQHLQWTERGGPITLRLSSSAFGLFKVTPNAIAYFARGLNVTYPEDIARECDHLDGCDDDDVADNVRRARERVAAARAARQSP